VVQTQSPWSLPPLKLKPVAFLSMLKIIVPATTLIAMGHPQPSTGTPLVTDNSTSMEFFKKICRERDSKPLGSTDTMD
jgi:hypothetical protein